MPRATPPAATPIVTYQRLRHDLAVMQDLLAADLCAHAARNARAIDVSHVGDLEVIREHLLAALVAMGNYQDEDEGRAAIDRQIAARR
jgi:hypothetical protein